MIHEAVNNHPPRTSSRCLKSLRKAQIISNFSKLGCTENRLGVISERTQEHAQTAHHQYQDYNQSKGIHTT